METDHDLASPVIRRTESYLLKHFYYFSVVASLNHALAYVVTAYASSLLHPLLASCILGLMWMLNAFSGMFFTTYFTKRLGYRNAMVLAHWGYSVLIISLFISVRVPSVSWVIGIVGSSFAGITSAIWWTAQGVCFEQTCELLHESTDTNKMTMTESDKLLNDLRARLSAVWTIIYQSADIVVFMSLTAAPLLFHTSVTTTIIGLSVVGVMTSVLSLTFDSLDISPVKLNWNDIKISMFAVPTQFVVDARSILLAPFVFGFGITTAMFAYYINGHVTNSMSGLGTLYIGALEAYTYFIAVLSAWPYQAVGTYIQGGNHWIMQYGSLCFMSTGILVLVLNDYQLSRWYTILILRTLYGMGRGVFEGACRAVYAELFRGDDLSTAYSAQTLFAGLSGGLCFFLYNSLSKDQIAWITFLNGILAIVGYTLIILHHNQRDTKKNQRMRWSDIRFLKLVSVPIQQASKRISTKLQASNGISAHHHEDDDDHHDDTAHPFI